jgi:hypothetical protein
VSDDVNFANAKLINDPNFGSLAKKLFTNSIYDEAGNPKITYGFNYPKLFGSAGSAYFNLWFIQSFKVILICLFFIVLGLWLGHYVGSKTESFFATAISANGIVMHYNMKPGKNVTYEAIIKFTTLNGRVVEGSSGTSSGIKPYTIGQQVPIFYDSINPYHFEINDFWSRHLLVYFCYIPAIFGLLVMLSSLVGDWRDYTFEQFAIPIPGTVTFINKVQIFGQILNTIQVNAIKPNGGTQKWDVNLTGTIPEIIAVGYPLVVMIDPTFPLQRYAIIWQPSKL